MQNPDIQNKCGAVSLHRIMFYSFFSISILNIFRSRPARDFGARTTTILTVFPPLTVFYISANIPIAISKTHKTKTRNPDGNTAPRRIPTAAAIAQTMYALPLFLHIYNTRLSNLSLLHLTQNTILGCLFYTLLFVQK